ncbi:hypothetical protein B0O99DRAFT_515557 [Bisporella sp. PMI_857]|nr:hypothetical protein B0O99DRAFT_515557 [Bisporella sp. PMI_857]
MSEVQSRPAAPRGRGSARGGRGGFSARGGRGGRHNTTNGDKPEPTHTNDDSEVAQLKKKYGSKVSTIKEMFPDWTDEDVVFALQETNGDLETTVERITEGSITQWGEVSKVKKSKAKEPAATILGDSTNTGKGSRGGRANTDSGRGRGRGIDRGRSGRGRGASVAHTNGSRKENAPAAAESNAWDTTAPTEAPTWDTKPSGGDDSSTAGPTNVAAKAASSIIPDGVKKSWASMFAPHPPTPKKAPEPVEKPAEAPKPEQPIETPLPEPDPPLPEAAPVELSAEVPIEAPPAEDSGITVTPSKDELTETNLEQVPDASQPAPSATAASTAASSWDPRNTSTGTPYASLQQNQPQAIRQPPSSGFQASAQKATGTSGRTPSYQRRVLDQEEAVRMPGNREVERTAVQFGAFNLNGSGDEDVDGDREEPETRAQPPQHSPVTHPRAALPPAPQQPATVQESLPTPKQPTGLPAAPPSAAPGLPSPQAVPGAQNGQQGPQASRYGYGNPGAQDSSLPPKPFDAFGQQAPSTQSPFEGYQNQQSQSQSQAQSGAFSSAPNDYSSYYTSDPQQRAAYNSYYQQQQYGVQPGAHNQQDGTAPQRSYSGYGGPQAEGAGSQLPQSAAQQAQSRFPTAGEGQNSGHSTPNPAAQAQSQSGAQGAQPQQGQPQQLGGYPYGHPYYGSPYYQQYAGYGAYGGGNYPGGPYGAKGGVHGQQAYPGYGMSPAYDHTASPAAGGFGGSSLQGRDTGLGSFSDYGRGGSAQSSQAPQGISSGAFGGSHEAFGRGSSYQGQNQQHYNANQSAQQGASDDLKPFGESKTTNGPSPSLTQAGRPGSATNAAPGSALPPPQSQPGGYAGYPSHLQQGHGLHGSQAAGQYTGLGGATGHQSAGQGHQNSPYGGYQGFGGNYYGNSQQQQRGGWGGNYGH